MDVQTEAAISKARGRKGADKQEGALKMGPIKDSIDELVALKTKADAAADRLNDAIKVAAERSNIMASVIRRFVVARAGENFEEKKRDADQLSLVFSEVGEG